MPYRHVLAYNAIIIFYFRKSAKVNRIIDRYLSPVNFHTTFIPPMCFFISLFLKSTLFHY